MDNLKQYYMTVFSVAYSQCGNYLVAGNNYGVIAIFNLKPFLECEDSVQESQRRPFFKISGHSSPIYALVSTKKLIISGSIGEINAWDWTDVKNRRSKAVWTIPIPQGDNLTKPEVNSLVVNPKNDEVYAGCGDNKIYCFDTETGAEKFTLSGHTDYIHCVVLGNGSQECVSGSEDGSVRIWDARKGGKEVHIIEPYKHQMSARPQFGKWVGCIALDESDEWLVCGGAPTLCMWNLRALLPSTQFSKESATNNVVRFHDDNVISGGSEPFINHWSLDGQLITEVPASASSIFDIAITSNPTHENLSVCGSSYKIDICADFRFRDFSLLFA